MSIENFIIMKKILVSMMFVVATFTISCSQTTPANQASESESVFGPAIEFTETEHNFGTIEQGGDGTYEFIFTNSGSEPLVLSNVRSSCGCTVPTWPKEPINASESSSILVKYDTRRIGQFNKSITVYSNASEQPIVLHIKGNVEAPAQAATTE